MVCGIECVDSVGKEEALESAGTLRKAIVV